jgi:hypothetical protein
MLEKIFVSFGISIIIIYLFFCLLLINPIMTNGNVKEIPQKTKFRWFWVLSLYIGKTIIIGIVLLLIIGIPYLLIYGFN